LLVINVVIQKNQPSAVTQALAWATKTLESLQHNPLALGGVGVALGVIPVILYFACRSGKSDEATGERIGEKKEEVKDEPKNEDEKEVKEEKKTPAKSGTRRRLDN
jgi:predicted PurR-regulated permease PerM